MLRATHLIFPGALPEAALRHFGYDEANGDGDGDDAADVIDDDKNDKKDDGNDQGKSCNL